MAVTTRSSLKQELFAYARGRGADTIGVCAAGEFERSVPNLQKPSTTSSGMESLVVFARHMLTGSLTTASVPLQSFNSHLCMEEVDRLSDEIAGWLEERGHLAIPVPPESAWMDLDPRKPMGTLDFKWVAEAAGIGTAGLELNLLTPEYGPRVYLGVVMTEAVLEPDPPLAEDLCPGLQCGRCAVTCSTDAIPTEGARGSSVREYRGLNKRRCALGAERIGIRPLHLNAETLLSSQKPISPRAIVDNKFMRDFWQSMNNKVGAFAACFECWYVCPVGPDYRRLMRVPYRQNDLPRGTIKHVKTDTTIGVVWTGPPEDRKPEYAYDRTFQTLVGAKRASTEAESSE